MFDPPYDASTWIPYLQLLVEAIKGVAWPSAFAFLVYNFRDELRPLLANIKSLGPTGVTFSDARQISKTPDDGSDELATGSPTPLNNPVADRIRQNLTVQLEAFNSDSREEELIKSLTFRLLEKNFFTAYLNIFGSQISALEKLNVQPINKDRAKELFKDLQSEHEELRKFSLDQYLNYLFNWEFIERDEDGEQFRITQNGRDFLVFLQSHGLPKDRPL
ncbi:helix-turn-helix domain-containing protein [Mameliella alba]|uniref:Uncharacterized protein n=1 Tax=Mameliella alba TaxID=561184 RepID=A0A0B3S3A5_9RHOB|nr:hypothetical protein [Mameliella alba]KHQ51171.1 hypothetical protein OA50_04202 [Mameliella alba]